MHNINQSQYAFIKYANNTLISLGTFTLSIPTTSYLSFASDNCKLFNLKNQYYTLENNNVHPITSIVYPYTLNSRSSSFRYLINTNALYRLNDDGANSINNVF